VDDVEVEGLLAALRLYGAEDTSLEAKRAKDRLPSTTVETLSAFANLPGGGILILGVDEMSNFAVTGVSNAQKLSQDLAAAARTQLSPPLQPVISIRSVEGKLVVIAEIPELPREEKPCYVTTKGMTQGSFLRVADGDRHLTAQEVHLLVADRGQPRFDSEPVREASIADLDQNSVQLLLQRLRQTRQHPFTDRSDEEILKMIGVLKNDETNTPRPSLAGMLALGIYPQQYFPQLCLTFVHYPTRFGEQGGSTRFLDNIRIDGSIPNIANDSLRVIMRNMSRRALVTAQGRLDVWDYPPEALREAVVNALVHRDLSPGSRGTQVQIEMYPDRLRIMNPGGLYGPVDITRLGEEGVSSARNSLLLRILEDVPSSSEGRTVCENRGSGIRTMRHELARAGMSPPEFRDKVTSFEVVMPNHTLFDEPTLEWLGRMGRDGLKDTQRTSLALMLRGQIFDNAKYRAATGISDSRVATTELQDLVARELVEQAGRRGGARYSLSDYARSLAAPEGSPRVRPNRRRQILELVLVHGDLSKSAISRLLNINPKTAEHWITKLKKEGFLQATEPGRGNKATHYRLAPYSSYIPGQIVIFEQEVRLPLYLPHDSDEPEDISAPTPGVE